MKFETEMEEITRKISSFSNFGKKIGLENIKKICAELNNPQDFYKTIHIAGTNGKGSVATTIEAILLEAGIQVGKFTSPHITNINERITLNGAPISDLEFIKYFKIVDNVIKKIHVEPTFFEIITAMMFLYFKDKKITYLILETGLGGRFDSTNIVKSDFALITNISYDHCNILGDTLEKITFEKLGIVKNNSIVLIGENTPLIESELTRINLKKLILSEEYSKNSSYILDFENFITKINIDNSEYLFSLFGHHQYKNFLLAFALAKELKIDTQLIKSAIQKVTWQCRFQVIKKKNIFLILDGGHNEEGIKVLKNTLLSKYTPNDITTVTSILEDKNIPIILEEISQFSKNIIFTSLSNIKRGLNGNQINERWENLTCIKNDEFNIEIENNIEKTLKSAFKKNTKIIVYCGSFYLLSKLKEIL